VAVIAAKARWKKRKKRASGEEKKIGKS